MAFSSNAARAPIKFLVIADIHYGSENTSKDGVDAGDALLALSMNQFKTRVPEVDFILNLGDIPTHLLGYSPSKAGYEARVFSDLLKADALKKPMFYVSGNNDSIAGNYQPFSDNGISPLKYATGWDGACAFCKDLLIDKSMMLKGGYYSSYVISNNKDIILIALNATQWMKQYIFLPHYPNQEHDAQTQFKWLNNQLKNHHAKLLLIAMHEPPGFDYKGNLMWKDKYHDAFLKLLDRYQSHYREIVLLTAHTHMDEIRHIRLPSGRELYGFSTPSVSRIYHNNSAMKVFALDAKLRLKDFTTFYTQTNSNWGSDQYHALGANSSIFPQCSNKTIAQCLKIMDKNQVCSYIEQGYFYSVKSKRVDNKPCLSVYDVTLTH